MMPLDEVSLKSRTESSARCGRESEGGSHVSLITNTQIRESHRCCIDTLTNCFKSSIVQSFLSIITIRGLDEYPMVPRSVRANIYRKLGPSKPGIYLIT